MDARGQAIVLIGFMGAGKSSVGQTLTRRTGLPLFDTDALVSERLGLSIAEIFSSHGEEVFRVAETAELNAIALDEAIVVTGGGIVLRPENVAALKRLGVVVHLTADEATLFERATRRTTRPLLHAADPRATFSQLLRARAPLYRSAADVTIETSGLRHDDVAEEILSQTRNLLSHVI